MLGKTGRGMLLLLALAAMVCSSPLQAFSFCFSFGSSNNNYSQYRRYPPPFPPPSAAYYPALQHPQWVPNAVYSPVYPSPELQPYGVLPAQPGE